MRNFKGLLPASVLTTIALSGSALPVVAEVSANVGFASEYYYRGSLQKESSASVGVDFEQSGFYLGTWSADVGDGLEVDLYGGYTLEFGEGFSVGVGVIGYYYTGEFDDTYEEINLRAGWGPVSIGYSVGTYGNFSGDINPMTLQEKKEQDYDFLEIKFEHKGFYATYGTFGDEFDGDYIELGYGAEVSGFDLGVAAILSSDELSDQLDSNGEATESEALVFTLKKTFDL